MTLLLERSPPKLRAQLNSKIIHSRRGAWGARAAVEEADEDDNHAHSTPVIGMMRFVEILRIAFDALLLNKMRSLLTMLGIIIGVGAVIAMVAIGQGAQTSVEAQISSLGTNVLMVYPGSTTRGGVMAGGGTGTSLT